MHFADLVQENAAVIGLLELAQPLPAGAGEGAGLIAEQLALQQLAGDGGAVDLDERLVAAAGIGIDHPRDHFFAGAALAPDQHGGIGIGNLLDGHLHFFHLGTGAEQHREVALPAHLFAQLRHFTHQPQSIHHLIDPQIELLGLERLAHVIVGAQLGGAKDDLRIVLRGEHDHRRIGLDLLDPLQRLDAADAVHGDIQQHQVGIEDAKHANGFFAAGGGINFKVTAGQVSTQKTGHAGVVIHHQHSQLRSGQHGTSRGRTGQKQRQLTRQRVFGCNL